MAAFVVFAFHVRNVGYFTGNAQSVMTSVFGAGATGVSLFFVLSGFVLGWAHRPEESPMVFWRHRLARIYPLHLMSLALALVLAAKVIPQITTADPTAVLANAALMSSWRSDWWQAGNPVSWSLVCEAFFYVIFPVIIGIIRRLGGRLLIASALLATAVVIAVPFLVKYFELPISATSSPIARLPEFVLGIVLARLLSTQVWRGPGVALAVMVTALGYGAALLWPESLAATTGFTIVGFCLLITALARADIRGKFTILSTRPFVWLGSLSFAFYLVHLLVIQTGGSLFSRGAPNLPTVEAIALTIAALTISVTLAWLFHHFVEIPGRHVILGGLSKTGDLPRPGALPRSGALSRCGIAVNSLVRLAIAMLAICGLAVWFLVSA